MTRHDPLASSGDSVDEADDDGRWRALPPRALTLFTLSAALSSAVLAVAAMIPIGLLLPAGAPRVSAALAALVLLPAVSIWLARKRYRYTRWRQDGEGFAVRRGRFWTLETRVPGSRVQHLDLVRGPLQRRFDLATLVIHTAGTRHSAVSLAGMDAADAERLRDELARGTGPDDDA